MKEANQAFNCLFNDLLLLWHHDLTFVISNKKVRRTDITHTSSVAQKVYITNSLISQYYVYVPLGMIGR